MLFSTEIEDTYICFRQKPRCAKLCLCPHTK